MQVVSSWHRLDQISPTKTAGDRAFVFSGGWRWIQRSPAADQGITRGFFYSERVA